MRRPYALTLSLAFSALMLCLFVPRIVAAQDTPPPPPNGFLGAVTINGENAPIGTVLEARGNGVRIGIPGNPVTTTVTGIYGGPVPGDRKLVVQGRMESGTLIEFYINGQRAECAPPSGEWTDTFPFQPGTLVVLNLRLGGDNLSQSILDLMRQGTLTPPTATPAEQSTQVPATSQPPGPAATATRLPGAPTLTPVAMQVRPAATPPPGEAARPEATVIEQAVVGQPSAAAPAATTMPAAPVTAAPAEATATAAPVSVNPQSASPAPQQVAKAEQPNAKLVPTAVVRAGPAKPPSEIAVAATTTRRSASFLPILSLAVIAAAGGLGGLVIVLQRRRK